MPSSTETAEFRLVVDGGLANRALDETRARALGLGGGIGMLNERLDQLGGKAGKDAANAMRSMSFALGSVGSKAGEVVSVMGDLADLWMGGAFVAGIAAVGFGVAKVSEAFAEAEAGARGFDEAVVSLTEHIERTATAKIDAMRSSTAALALELKSFGLDTRQQAIEAAQNELATAERARGNIAKRLLEEEDRLDRAQAFATSLRGTAYQEAYQSAKNGVAALSTLLTQTDRRIEAANAALTDTTRIALELDAKEEERTRKEATKRAAEEARATAFEIRVRGIIKRADDALGKSPEALLQRDLAAEEARATAFEIRVRGIIKRADDALGKSPEALLQRDLAAEDAGLMDRQRALFKLREADVDRREKLATASSDKLTQIERDGAKERELIYEAETAKREAIAAQWIGIGVNASQQLINDIVTGQEDALAHFASAVATQTGTALIGYGTQAAAAGIVAGFNAAAPLAATPPLAAAAFAAAAAPGLGQGAAFIGSGLAMGGIGAGLGNIGASRPGGTGGSFSSSAASDVGVAPRGGGSFGGGGEPQAVNININYGLGPVPEKMARDLAGAMKDAEARRILSPRGNGPRRLR